MGYLKLFRFMSVMMVETKCKLNNTELFLKLYHIQARREGGGGCDGCARTPPQTAEVHFFVKKINSKRKIIVLFCLFCSNSLIA